MRTLERLAWMWDHQGFGLFAVDWRGDLPDEAAEAAARLGLGEEAARFAGWVGLSVPKFLPEILPAVEIGWRLGGTGGDAASRPRPRPRCCASASATWRSTTS